MNHWKALAEKFIAISCTLVLFLFANHCFLEEACASLGKVDLGVHPHSDSDNPCHESSSDSGEEAPCSLMVISASKALSNLSNLSHLGVTFAYWNLNILSTLANNLPTLERVLTSFEDQSFPINWLYSLDAAAQAPPAN